MSDRLVTALPWFLGDEYASLLLLVTDPEKLPEKFEDWLQRAEATEKHLQSNGYTVVRSVIRVAAFATWCKQRDVLPDQRARFGYAKELAGTGTSEPEGNS
jgi:hypothetical protein